MQTFMDTSLLAVKTGTAWLSRHIALHLISLTMPMSQRLQRKAACPATQTPLSRFNLALRLSSPTPFFRAAQARKSHLAIEASDRR